MRGRLKRILVAGVAVVMAACAGKEVDPSTPAPVAEQKSMMDRLSQEGGYRQDSEGNWVPRTDKRSSFDSQRESAYFKGNVEKSDFRTGEFKKRSWWGNKDFGNEAYAGDTDGSRFQTSANQQGKRSQADGARARTSGAYQTNRLGKKAANEGRNASIGRPLDSGVEARRGTYSAPAVVDWQANRNMSVEQSRGILGR